jgi:hypothetical protein
MAIFEKKLYCPICKEEVNHRGTVGKNTCTCLGCMNVQSTKKDEPGFCVYYRRDTDSNRCIVCSACSKPYGECYAFTYDIEKTKYELDALKTILNYSHSITLNANDFFGYACADAIDLDICDLFWVIPIVQKYGYDGIAASMYYIRKCKPIEPIINEKFEQAYKEIEELKPKVFSEVE